MAASYVVEFYDRVSGCWSHDKMSSELAASKTCCDIAYIENVLDEKTSLSYKMVFDLKTKCSSLKMNNITVI